MVTLAIWGEVTTGAILTKCGLWGDIVDIITCAIFRDCRLRGVGVVRGVSLPSPIDLTRRPYNTVTVWLHTRTVVRECCKSDDASQWRSPKFDPPPRSNPVPKIEIFIIQDGGAAILKITFLAITHQPIIPFQGHFVWGSRTACRQALHDKNCELLKSKMADSRHFENR